MDGWINLHLLVWKQLVRIEEEGEKYAEHKILGPRVVRGYDSRRWYWR